MRKRRIYSAGICVLPSKNFLWRAAAPISITDAMATEETPNTCKNDNAFDARAWAGMLLYTARAEGKRRAMSHAIREAIAPCTNFVENKSRD